MRLEIEDLLRENGISKTKLAKILDYTVPGLFKALKIDKSRNIIYDRLLVYLLRKAGLNLETLVKELSERRDIK